MWKYRPHICNYLMTFLFSCSMLTFTTGLKFMIMMETTILEFNIIWVNSVCMTYIIILDYMSLLFMSVVLLIASTILFFSKDYMSSDPNINRFIWLVFMFVLSMMSLILSPNLISILMGWDGLGLVSYCLVIYYQNVKSYNAGMLTALTNRIGDVMILIAIAIMNSMGSFNLLNYSWGPFNDMMLYCTVLLIIAACTKSAQIPFSAWLPAAMAAPTPVSALVHSSTLVTAGVYMLIRFSEPIMKFGLTKYILVISVLTMLMAGLGANLEMDLKKVIALSTLSQLGLMIMAISINMPKLAYFHMLSHALFKALLFMCAGNIIHGSQDTQDIRKMGNIIMQMPVTSACLNTANLALCGIPFMAGFYSKDMILESMLFSNYSMYILLLVYFATALTVMYSVRLSYYALSSSPNNYTIFNLSDKTKFSSPATMPLTIMSIIGGTTISWIIFPTPSVTFFTTPMKTLILLVLTIGFILSLCLIFNNNLLKKFNMSNKMMDLLGSMWFMPTLSTRLYSMKYLNIGYLLTYNVDRGWTEFLTVKWMVNKMTDSKDYLQKPQSASLKLHLITFISWFLFVMLICLI
nr:NADH dehydrogenase subunit 5 [Procloeon bifidum]